VGQGIEARERFTNLIEDALGPRYEVLNSASRLTTCRSISTSRSALTAEPNFILLAAVINDFETAAMQRPQPHPLISDAAARGWGRSSVLYDMVNGQWVRLQEFDRPQ